MHVIAWIAHLLSAVGAINWGLVKFFKFNLVDYVVGITKLTYLNEVLYAGVAVSGVYAFIALFTW